MGQRLEGDWHNGKTICSQLQNWSPGADPS